MPVEKKKVLGDASAALNKPDQPWQITVEGDSIVARWKWMDAAFFSPNEVNDQTKEYTFTVTLDDKGKWKEIDKEESKAKGLSLGGGGLKLGSSSQTFIGSTNKKSFQFGAGANKQTGEVGFVGFKFDTSKVKQPIRAYLESCGWKKAGLFGLF